MSVFEPVFIHIQTNNLTDAAQVLEGISGCTSEEAKKTVRTVRNNYIKSLKGAKHARGHSANGITANSAEAGLQSDS